MFFRLFMVYLSLMKRIIACGLSLAIALIFVAPRPAFAFMGFGGTVVTNFTAGVACLGEGPVTIKPAGTSPSGPYAPTLLTMRYGSRYISSKSNIKGLYIPFLIPGICWTTSVPSAPVLVFPIIMFGTSR